MNNARWKNLIAAFNKIPVLPFGERPAWHISFVAIGEISHVSDGLSAILDKGITFKTDANFFTPDETEIALTADEKEFLIRNRLSVLWLLQMDALYLKEMFNYPNAVLEFNLKYLQKFTAVL